MLFEKFCITTRTRKDSFLQAVFFVLSVSLSPKTAKDPMPHRNVSGMGFLHRGGIWCLSMLYLTRSSNQWFCHSRWWVIPGTEDMTEAYHDYAFHWKWFFIGLVSRLLLSAVCGGITVLLGR